MSPIRLRLKVDKAPPEERICTFAAKHVIIMPEAQLVVEEDDIRASLMALRKKAFERGGLGPRQCVVVEGRPGNPELVFVDEKDQIIIRATNILLVRRGEA